MRGIPRRPATVRPRNAVALLAAAVGCVLVLALLGWGRSQDIPSAQHQDTRRSLETHRLAGDDRSGSVAPPSPVPARRGSPFTLMQMNLCLSGLAGCYATAAYPAVVREAVARIDRRHPDAVTVNEACRYDAARVARRTGYRLRFSRVVYLGAPLQCRRPGNRGLFGDAVLLAAPIAVSDSRPFQAQSGREERRWLCVRPRRGPDVCTAHLSTRRTRVLAATNDAQCAELARLLARRAAGEAAVVFGGDVNRHRDCAPEGMWARTDRSAGQAPGLQHVYGSRARLRSPATVVLPAAHSDHDWLLVRARPAPR